MLKHLVFHSTNAEAITIAAVEVVAEVITVDAVAITARTMMGMVNNATETSVIHVTNAMVATSSVMVVINSVTNVMAVTNSAVMEVATTVAAEVVDTEVDVVAAGTTTETLDMVNLLVVVPTTPGEIG